MTRNSNEWAAEVDRLKADLASTEQAIDEQTVALAGALLESHESVAVDCQNQTVALEARRRGLASAIETAEQRRQAALADEQRQRDSLRLRQACAGVATWLELTARIVDAKAALARAQAERQRQVDQVQLMHNVNWAGARGLDHPDDVANGTAEQLRGRIPYYEAMAERGVLNGRGQVVLSDEALDPATVPPKPQAVPTAEEQAAASAGVRRSQQRQVTSLLDQARRSLERCVANSDRAGIATYRAEAERLEGRLAELEAEPVAVPV